MTTLSFIIPVFNEEKTLESIVSKVFALQKTEYAEKNNIQLELVLIDDCSSDNSLKIARKLADENPNIKVFSHKKNSGKGAALKTGFEVATGDYIGIQDADMEYNPFDYLKMFDVMIKNDADVVYGSRYLKRDTRRVLYFWHTFMNQGLTFLSNMYTNLGITDMETCYKLFKKDVIKKIAPELKENRFGFEPEVTIYVAKGKYKVYETAIDYFPRTYEEGKKIGAKDGLRALYCIMHYGGHCAPLPMQVILYLFIGAISALVNIALFLTFAQFLSDVILNVILAFVVSAIVNYLLCISLLFRHKARWSSFGEIMSYIVSIVIMCAVDCYLTSWFLSIGMSNFWAKALAIVIGFVGNFVLRKYFVFQERKQ